MTSHVAARSIRANALEPQAPYSSTSGLAGLDSAHEAVQQFVGWDTTKHRSSGALTAKANAIGGQGGGEQWEAWASSNGYRGMELYIAFHMGEHVHSNPPSLKVACIP
ncbi:hypothetical protein AJ80_04963 [Polytolypa hystricis UAMH7299]|uniref:Uncharacterized protein n=1 Tax=Polytolypa hystricis (strain UAMH7299) TaxID=1447883 RepID=A0A2B7Y7A9_POLH7|nr:hypothetical protein AJ80_04963 [Polytolypa hystricis UAMH7299]